MKGNGRPVGEGDAVLDTFAAEITLATFDIALRHGMAGSWLDLELDRWGVLAETVKCRGREAPRAARSGEFDVWREGFLAELTAAAHRTALRHRVPEPSPEAELGLYRAFRSVIGEIGRRRCAT
jgi:hypothetical protein